MIKKTFESWLIIDWKTGKMRVTSKQLPESRVKFTEIPVKLSFEIEIPDKPQLIAEGKITLSDARVAKIVASEI